MHKHSYAAGALGILLALNGSAALAQSMPEPARAMPVAPPSSLAPQAPGNDPWQHVVPEQGVVVSGNGTPYGAPSVQPAPVYAAPIYMPPVYVQPGWGWPGPYVYPPIGVSIGLGYSRGWHGGGWHGHRGWR